MQQGASAVKSMLNQLRTSTQKVLRDHEQQQERIAQENVLEQKRIEQAKVAAAEQKARQEAAAEAARRAALEKETAYTRTFERGHQAGQADNSESLRRYYAPDSLEANQNRPQSKPTTAPKKKESEVNLPVPIPLVGQFITTAFANVGMVGGMPTPLFYVPTKGMMPTKDGNGIQVLGTPGGEGVNNGVDVEGFPVQRRQPDVTGIPADAPQKPDVTGIPAASSEERGPQVGVFPRTLVAGPDILMAKKVGGEYTKGDNIDLGRFTKQKKLDDGSRVLEDPKTGEYIEKDRGVNSGSGSHGGSYWKLKDRLGKRIGTISEDGKWLRE